MQHVFHIHMQVLDVQNLHSYSTILANRVPLNDQFLGDLSTSGTACIPQPFTEMSQKWLISTKSSKMGDSKKKKNQLPINMRLHLHQSPWLCHLKESGQDQGAIRCPGRPFVHHGNREQRRPKPYAIKIDSPKPIVVYQLGNDTEELMMVFSGRRSFPTP